MNGTIDPTARVAAEVVVGEGTSIGFSSFVGKAAFVGPGVLTADDNFMGRGDRRFGAKQAPVIGARSRIGAGAVLLPASVVGDDCYVAAGAVVSGDIPAGSVVMGVPARVTG